MLEININKISKNYGFNAVLNNLSFDVKTGERIALVGDNGCGKTTTLKIIIGEETADTGRVNIRKESSIGYLKQIPQLENDDTLANDVYLRGVKDIIELENKIKEFVNNMSSSNKDIKNLSKLEEEFRIKEGYKLKEKVEKIKHGFNLSEELLNTKYNNLSGGEKTIINLASIILSNPDIILLDEPTNHLDIKTLEWFEEYLINYNGTLVIVSHDRYFLDKVVTKVIKINNGSSEIYQGNYSYYLEESEKRFLLQFQNYKNQQKEINNLKEAIKRYKEWGQKSDNPMFFKRAHAIETRLEKMELIDKPKEKNKLKLNIVSGNRSANKVLDIEKITLQIGERKLIDNSSMHIYYKERVCLMGNNGCGKTTLIKNILNNTHENIKLGANITLGYIPQEIRFDNDDLTLYEYVRKYFTGTESELRSKLYQFYFGEETIEKKIKNISGGEKVRLKLLELIFKKANFLILDEPTNHIDIDTKEILEQSLLEFDGTILFVSHDRYFINKISTKIIRIENKKFVEYIGNYDSIKTPQVIDNKNVEIKQVINIKGSNRLNEFIKDSKIDEMPTDKTSRKVYKIRKKSKVFFLKISDHLSQESIRLDYLSEKTIVPQKVFYEKYNGKSYLMVKSLEGKSLSDEYYINNPLIGIDLIVEAFNALYSIDYSDCTIDETIDTKIKKLEEKINNSNMENYYLERFNTKENIIKYLKGNKPKQLIGFIHGNMSLSNIFINNGKFSGFIGIDECGIGDIYFDLVICEKSIEKYYGKEYIDIFYEKIGIEKDEFKSDYYRILTCI